MTEPGCPDVRNWQALLEEGGTESVADEIVRHLETCADCRQTLETLAAEPAIWLDTAQSLTDAAWEEPALRHVMDRLKSEESPLLNDTDLSFLQPTDKSGLLGLVGRYEILEEIGRGGMGVVFKAVDPDLNRTVAIKVLSPWLASSAMARRRFVREGRAAAAVCHDHIVTVYAVNDRDGLPYLVMQYVAGESLQARLDRLGPLEMEDAVRIGLQTAFGLAAAHAQGLIHRDIKPANLLLENGLARVKITDFGLARMTDDVQLTQNGVVTGTPEFMAPEQARGETVDHRADLFSLGSVLYAMCTGVPPFGGSTPLAVLRQVNDHAPPPIRELNSAISSWLEILITRLLAKNPRDRFQSAAEVADLLEGYLAHLRQPTTVSAPPLPPSPLAIQTGRQGMLPRIAARRWLIVAGGIVCVLGLLGVLSLGMAIWLGRTVTDGEKNAHDVAYDFRGRPLPVDIEPYGIQTDQFVKVEAEGLRITLPKDRLDTPSQGLTVPLAVTGDFEVTTTFEIIQVDEPPPGTRTYGTGVLMSVNQAARIGRLSRAKGEQVVSWDRWGEADGKRKFLTGTSPCRDKVVRLRLKRTANSLHFLWAPEIAGDNFEEIQQFEYGGEDLTELRLELNGRWEGHPANLDVRLVELKVHSGDLTADQVRALEEGRKTRSNRWLAVAGGFFGLTTLVMLATCLAALRFRTTETPENDPIQENQAPSAPPVISLSCAACGKNLKARAELAGRKVRCSQCGQAVLVPSVKTDTFGAAP